MGTLQSSYLAMRPASACWGITIFAIVALLGGAAAEGSVDAIVPESYNTEALGDLLTRREHVPNKEALGDLLTRRGHAHHKGAPDTSLLQAGGAWYEDDSEVDPLAPEETEMVEEIPTKATALFTMKGKGILAKHAKAQSKKSPTESDAAKGRLRAKKWAAFVKKTRTKAKRAAEVANAEAKKSGLSRSQRDAAAAKAAMEAVNYSIKSAEGQQTKMSLAKAESLAEAAIRKGMQSSVLMDAEEAINKATKVDLTKISAALKKDVKKAEAKVASVAFKAEHHGKKRVNDAVLQAKAAANKAAKAAKKAKLTHAEKKIMGLKTKSAKKRAKKAKKAKKKAKKKVKALKKKVKKAIKALKKKASPKAKKKLKALKKAIKKQIKKAKKKVKKAAPTWINNIDDPMSKRLYDEARRYQGISHKEASLVKADKSTRRQLSREIRTEAAKLKKLQTDKRNADRSLARHTRRHKYNRAHYLSNKAKEVHRKSLLRVEEAIREQRRKMRRQRAAQEVTKEKLEKSLRRKKELEARKVAKAARVAHRATGKTHAASAHNTASEIKRLAGSIASRAIPGASKKAPKAGVSHTVASAAKVQAANAVRKVQAARKALDAANARLQAAVAGHSKMAAMDSEDELLQVGETSPVDVKDAMSGVVKASTRMAHAEQALVKIAESGPQ